MLDAINNYTREALVILRIDNWRDCEKEFWFITGWNGVYIFARDDCCFSIAGHSPKSYWNLSVVIDFITSFYEYFRLRTPWLMAGCARSNVLAKNAPFHDLHKCEKSLFGSRPINSEISQSLAFIQQFLFFAFDDAIPENSFRMNFDRCTKCRWLVLLSLTSSIVYGLS